MLRCLLTLVALAATITPAIPAPQLKDRTPAELYFPTAVGTRWVYLEGKSEETEVITRAEARGGVTVVTVFDEVRTRSSRYAVGRDGLALGGTECGPDGWMRLLNLPAKAGDRWYTGGVGFRVITTAGEPEDVRVPAGTFRAIPVTEQFEHFSAGQTLRGKPWTRWYAPNVGLVRVKWGDNDRVLKFFTPGKK